MTSSGVQLYCLHPKIMSTLYLKIMYKGFKIVLKLNKWVKISLVLTSSCVCYCERYGFTLDDDMVYL